MMLNKISIVTFVLGIIISVAFGELYDSDKNYERDDNHCGPNATWSLENRVLTISGSGQMSDFTSTSPAPWSASKDLISQIIIENGRSSN